MNNGLRPVRPDHRDYGFNQTFGTISPLVLPDIYDCDAGFGAPNQNADGLPYGCTGYAQSQLCQDEDQTQYKPQYTYDRTLLMENSQEGQGCNIRDSLKSVAVYGVQALSENTDQEAMKHARAPYFSVQAINGDFFYAIQNALWLNRLERRSVSLGSPWFAEWERVGPDAVMPVPAYSGVASQYPWHNYKCSGFTNKRSDGTLIRNGEIFLKIASWQGPNYGDKGWVYMSRQVANIVFAIDGTAIFTLAKADPQNIQYIRLNIMQVLLSYYYRLFAKK